MIGLKIGFNSFCSQSPLPRLPGGRIGASRFRELFRKYKQIPTKIPRNPRWKCSHRCAEEGYFISSRAELAF